MSCTVAISNSPVFSPSTRVSSCLFCKSSSSSSSPETLKNVSSSSPSSPLRLVRIQKAQPIPSGLIRDSLPSSSSSDNPTSPSVLKRKRPTRLDIPIVSTGFGNIPFAVRDRDVLELEGDGFAVYCKKGRREAMEDRYSAMVDFSGESKQGCFGIFDGHGGSKAAEFTAENLNKNILDEIDKRENDSEDNIKEAIKNGYLKTDSEFLMKDQKGGSCSVTALIRKGNLVVSNAGDCRAVVSREGVAEALTSDHRPSREDEKHRIESLGGYVDNCNGVWRIHGSLAVSRGIGDQYLKQWVIAEPETRILSLNSGLEFLILASDGLWDKVSNQEAVDIVHPFFVDIDEPESLSVACRRLVDLSSSRGSADDISVMIIQLRQFCC